MARDYVYRSCEGGLFRFTKRQWRAVLKSIAKNDELPVQDMSRFLFGEVESMTDLRADEARDLLIEIDREDGARRS